MPVMSMDEIKSALEDRKLNVVAKAIGVHPNTLSELKNGRLTNPRYSTLEALSDYFNTTCHRECDNEQV